MLCLRSNEPPACRCPKPFVSGVYLSGGSAVGEMLFPSGINEGERQTELQNLTERVFPAVTMSHSYWGKELATQVNLSGCGG